jgi:hypothetical protein
LYWDDICVGVPALHIVSGIEWGVQYIFMKGNQEEKENRGI